MTDTLEQRISKAIFDGMLPSQGKVRVKILAPRIAQVIKVAFQSGFAGDGFQDAVDVSLAALSDKVIQ